MGNDTEKWINVTAVDDEHEIEMDAHTRAGASDAARYRYRRAAMTRWGLHKRDLGMVEDWKPGLPKGHRWAKPTTS